MTVPIRVMRLIFVMSTLVGAPLWFATPQQAQTTETTLAANIPDTDDVEKLVLQFAATETQVKSVFEKSEFETTAQFEARIKQGHSGGRQYAFAYRSYGLSGSASSSSRLFPKDGIFVFTERYQPSFTYNADEGVMTTSLFHLDSDPTIKVIVRRADFELGQNSYGARTDFLSLQYDEFAIVPSKASIPWLNGKLWQEYSALGLLVSTDFSFPLSIEQAQEIKPYLGVVLVGTVPDTWVHCTDSQSAATVTLRVERNVHRCEINFDITEVRIVDARTGKEVTTFTPSYGTHHTGEPLREWLSTAS